MLSRRRVIASGAGAAVLATLGYRTLDRGVFGARKGPAYEPWGDWQGKDGDGIMRPLHAAILAANPHDTQPWLFEPRADSIIIYADRARNLGTFDPFRREMHLGVGCALANLQMAAYTFGYSTDAKASIGRLTVSPPNHPLEAARVFLRRKNAPDNDLIVPDFPRLANWQPQFRIVTPIGDHICATKRSPLSLSECGAGAQRPKQGFTL
jgi:hypothetical protein